MQELPRLQEMLKEALTQTALECGTLLGQEMEIRETGVKEVTRDAYFNAMDDASFVVGIKSHEDYPGEFCAIFTFRDAIVLSGTLLGVPPARITEKKKLAIVEPDDVDAFSEIANQVVGSFNPVFKRCLPKKAHLKQQTPKKFIPHQDTVEEGEPIADGEYYLLQSQPVLAGKELERIDILIPVQLARLYDIQERANDAATADTDATEAETAEAAGDVAQETAPEPATVLVLENNAKERQEFQDMLAAAGVNPVVSSLDTDLKKLFTQSGYKAILVGLTNVSDSDLSVCLKISSNLKGSAVPIIMCAREWTRTSVLKALKYGAGDIMIKPCEPADLATRLQKLVGTA